MIFPHLEHLCRPNSPYSYVGTEIQSKYCERNYGQSDMKSANLTNEDIRKLYENMLRDEALDNYTFPTKPSSDGYYHIYVADSTKKTGRRAVKAKTLDELKEKVYEHEKGIDGGIKKTFKDVFEITQREKLKLVKSEERKLSVQNTINRNRTAYARFFSETAFERKYVCEITKLEKMISFIHEHQRKYPQYLPSYALELQIAIPAFRKHA